MNDERQNYIDTVWQYRKYTEEETHYRKAVIRNRDNVALAIGFSRKGCEQVANVFRSLGVDCRVVGASGGSNGKYVAWMKDGHQKQYKPRKASLTGVSTL